MVFNRKPRNEKQERLFQQWKQDVLSVLVASKTGIDTRKLQADLEENVGKVPIEEMGYDKWGEFLYEIRDLFMVGHNFGENPYNPRTRLFLFLNASAVSGTNENVTDILKLVRGQARGKTPKRRDGTTNAPTWNQVMRCEHKYLLGKTEAQITPVPARGASRGSYRGKSGGGGRGGGGFRSSNSFGGGSNNSRSSYSKVTPPRSYQSYNGNGNRLRDDSETVIRRFTNVLPSGFDDDGDSDDLDDVFDYCGGTSRTRPKPIPESDWSNDESGNDCVDNLCRPLSQLDIKRENVVAKPKPLMVTPIVASKPNIQSSSQSQTRAPVETKKTPVFTRPPIQPAPKPYTPSSSRPKFQFQRPTPKEETPEVPAQEALQNVPSPIIRPVTPPPKVQPVPQAAPRLKFQPSAAFLSPPKVHIPVVPMPLPKSPPPNLESLPTRFSSLPPLICNMPPGMQNHFDSRVIGPPSSRSSSSSSDEDYEVSAALHHPVPYRIQNHNIQEQHDKPTTTAPRRNISVSNLPNDEDKDKPSYYKAKLDTNTMKLWKPEGAILKTRNPFNWPTTNAKPDHDEKENPDRVLRINLDNMGPSAFGGSRGRDSPVLRINLDPYSVDVSSPIGRPLGRGRGRANAWSRRSSDSDDEVEFGPPRVYEPVTQVRRLNLDDMD